MKNTMMNKIVITVGVKIVFATVVGAGIFVGAEAFARQNFKCQLMEKKDNFELVPFENLKAVEEDFSLSRWVKDGVTYVGGRTDGGKSVMMVIKFEDQRLIETTIPFKAGMATIIVNSNTAFACEI